MAGSKPNTAPRDAATIRLGFVPLIDAAPLLVAHELGYFAAEGLHVLLDRQIGWGNVRDKLLFGKLHASHTLLGLTVAGAMDPASQHALVGVMSLGTGGDAITLSRQLTDAGVTSAAQLHRQIRLLGRGAPRLVLAHVFDVSSHHYLLRDWLAEGGINPDRDVELSILPPPQVAGHLAKGYLSGFCVGEPWNTLAQQSDSGRIVALTTDLSPGHPEKVLAVRREWAERNPDSVTRLIRATVRACDFCENPANRLRLAEILAKPQYLNVGIPTILASLQIDRHFQLDPGATIRRPPNWQVRSFSRAALEPRPALVHWLLSRMARWGHVPPGIDLDRIATQALDDRYFRRAVESDAETTAPTAFELEGVAR